MVTRWLFAALTLALALQRLDELRRSSRNDSLLRAGGAQEHGAGHYPWMIALHLCFLIAAPLEVILLERRFVPALAATMALLFLAAQALRQWSIRTLRERWTTRVLILPEAQPIVTGPYRFLRHPNYLAVAMELLSFPLLHGAWLTALSFSLLNGCLMLVRVRVEDRALGRSRRGVA